MKNDGSVFLSSGFIRHLLIIIFGIFTFPAVLGQSATISPSSPLNEAELNTQSITIDLGDGETFIDLTLPADSFALVDEPPGTSIGSVTGSTLTSAVITLNFDGSDFDFNYNVGIEIRAGELSVTGSGVLASSNTLPIDANDERVGIVPGPSSLDEMTLDASYLDITLTDEEFTGTGTIPNGNFTLNFAPGGLIIESVTASDLTHASMQLAYPPGNDFDSDVTNFSISVSGAVLAYTPPGDSLTSNNLTITAYTETPQSYLSIDSTVLEERWLDVRTLTIDLVEERFEDYTTLVAGDFELFDEPNGLTIESITRTSAVSVDIHLQFNYTDFDGDWPNFRVSINQLVLVQSGSDLVSGLEPIIANIESATLAPDVTLWEDNLDGRTLTVTLVNEEFQTPGSVDENDFVLNNYPTGLEIISASAISTTEAQLTLQYTGIDFDTDITNFGVGIAPGELRYTSSGNLNTGPITIQAIVENPRAFLASDDILTENSLDVRELTIALDQEEFDDAVTIGASHFRLQNEPPGLTIESAYRILPYDSARILLQFVYNDFDNDSTNFHVVIQASALIQTTTGWLATDSLTIFADTEYPVARLSADSALTEERLDFRMLYIDMEDESFIDWEGLQVHHFALENYPTGLSIQSVAGTSPTTVTIELNFNGTDFDNDINDFHVLIDSLVLVQSNQDLATDTLPIQASLEPVITDISIPNDTMNIDDTVRVTITVESDQGNTFLLISGEIGEYPLTTLNRENDTTYISSFIVTEFGNDYAAYESIPVKDVQLYNGLTPGNLYSQTIIQENDLLDANRPEIMIIYTTLTGEQDIGSVIPLRIRTDEAGHTFTSNSHVNDVLFSSPTIQINPRSGGNYDLLYTVEEGDNDVSEGNLELELIAVDIAENMSLPFTFLEDNDLSIDASRPVIDSAYKSSTDSIIIVGDSVDIWVMADQPGYRNHEDTWINHVPVGPNVEFNDLGNGLYEFRYTVQENDTAVSAGNLAINIVLQDRSPYENTSVAFQDLDSNNVAIYPNRPSAIVIGSTEICSGDSALITITLDGTSPPFDIDISYETGTLTMYNITEDTSFWTRPDTTTNYTVTRVVDSIGNFSIGIGNALITVHPLPDVEIFNLDSSYTNSQQRVELEYTPADGQFTGPGISPNPPWIFTPLLAGIEGSPHKIIYEVTDDNTCFNADTVIVEVVAGSGGIIFENERINACYNDSTFYITGYNEGNTIGTFSVEPEPPEGAFSDLDSNRAVLMPALYDLSENLDVKVNYTFTDTVGKENTLERWLTIYKAYPTANFTWNSSCRTDDSVVFEGQEIIPYPDTISSRMWKVYNGDTEIFRTDTNQLSYIFPSDGTFMISYSLTTVFGCIDSEEKTITLSPTHYLSENSYFENFEDTLHGWTSMALPSSPRNSWTYGEVDSSEFPKNAASGIRAWYTDLPASETIENSWVQSPCFNFNGFYRPMVSVNIKRSLDRNKDGVALQYTVDGKEWITVGSMDDGGINWYNTDDIWNAPPEQKRGWTGGQDFTEDTLWYKAAQGLDELTGHQEVRFRIAYISNGGSTIPNDGFAFDNFTIRKRSRLSVLEYFTDANTEACCIRDTEIRELMKKVPADVIDIQYHYHPFTSMADNLYHDYPIPANNRGTVYGVSNIPMAILNGGYEDGLGYHLIYDFITKYPTAEDIKLRSLIEPDFKITIEIDEYTSMPTIYIEALKDLMQRELVLYALVLEKEITDSKYIGTNGTTKFYQVAQRMVPDAAGILFNQSWEKGDIKNVPLIYEEEDLFPLNEDSLSIVVYLQDDYTREILQAATIPEYSSVSTFDMLEPESGVLLYPNPARELINVYFKEIPTEAMRFILYDLSGKMVSSDVIESWQQRYTRSLGHLKQGLYIVEIRTKNNKHVVHRGKLFHY
jgi:hypothetical protein